MICPTWLELVHKVINIQFMLLIEQKQVHISEARVSTALDKLAYMEELVNDKLLQERTTTEVSQTSSSPSTSFKPVDIEKRRSPRKSLDISGPVQSYHTHLKNFWYPVAFSTDLKDDTMVSQYVYYSLYHTLNMFVTSASIYSIYWKPIMICQWNIVFQQITDKQKYLEYLLEFRLILLIPSSPKFHLN